MLWLLPLPVSTDSFALSIFIWSDFIDIVQVRTFYCHHFRIVLCNSMKTLRCFVRFSQLKLLFLLSSAKLPVILHSVLYFLASLKMEYRYLHISQLRAITSHYSLLESLRCPKMDILSYFSLYKYIDISSLFTCIHILLYRISPFGFHISIWIPMSFNYVIMLIPVLPRNEYFYNV